MLDRKMRIETQRLMIRTFNKNDREEIFSIMKDKEMSRYTPDDQWMSINDADGFLNLVERLYDYESNTFRHFFAITDKVNNVLLGICGVGGVEYDRTQNEVFYHIGKQYWCNGYATEAGKAMLEYGFMQKNLDKIIGIVHADNIASNKVMEKIGLKRIGTISGMPDNLSDFNGEYIYEILKEDYLNQIK